MSAMSMSIPCPRLPQETLYRIPDLLHNNRKVLQEFCLLSTSRVPCTRKHLFAHIEFGAEDYDKWKKTFLEW